MSIQILNNNEFVYIERKQLVFRGSYSYWKISCNIYTLLEIQSTMTDRISFW